MRRLLILAFCIFAAASGLDASVQARQGAQPGDFAQANPGLSVDMISVQCKKQMVSEVRICLDKGVKFRTCEAAVADNCRAGAVLFRPVR